MGMKFGQGAPSPFQTPTQGQQAQQPPLQRQQQQQQQQAPPPQQKTWNPNSGIRFG
jgi:hypothetical protein